MIAQQSTETQPVNIKAAAWTIGVHVVLLLLFLLVKYTIPAPAVTQPDMGMEVNLGTDADGSGDDQPMATGDPAPDRSAAAYHAAAQQASEQKELMETEDADAPEVKRVPPVAARTREERPNQQELQNRSRNTQQQANTATTHTQPQKPRYVYNGATGTGGNGATTDRTGTGEGNTHGNGDRGVPGGTPGAANYTGNPGSGNGGISHTLGGRSISPSVFQAEFHEGGKVVIQVTVNRDGNIVSKQVISAPNAELRQIALQKLSQARFSSNPDGPPEQIGRVTILFKSRS
ncbi:energy transducer TonB [Chitinophagaceae bacterium MMS25-I14]